MNTENQRNPSKNSAFGILPKKATSSKMQCCHPSNPAPKQLWKGWDNIDEIMECGSC